MKFNSIHLGITAAFLLHSPVMADIKLTNGDFSNDSTGWSDLTGFSSTPYNTTGGVATAPADSSDRSLYQKVSTTLETAATVIFDVTVNTLGTGAGARDFDFRLVNGSAGNLANNAGLSIHESHKFIITGGGIHLFTSAFTATAGTTYTISLYMTGMDGAGGQMGRISGSILDNTTMVATRFSVSNANIDKFDGLAFRRPKIWGANTIDNITVTRELPTD